MTCDTFQNRLLVLPHPDRVPTELRPHLADCPTCRSFAAAAGRLDRLVAAIPVPPASASAMSALLDRIAEDSPIIVPNARPVLARGRFETWLAGTGWKVAAGLAASVVVGLAVWSSGPNDDRRKPTEFAYVRHELLKKEVDHVTRLATADSAPERLAIWADVATDLNIEAAEVYQIAPQSDIRAIGEMFDTAVRDGIIRQADQFPEHYPPADRHRILTAVTAKLKAVDADATERSTTAPPQSKPVLRQMAATAREGLARVEALRP